MKYSTVILAELLQPKGYIRGPFGTALKRSEMLSIGVPVYEQQHAIYNNRVFRFFISEKKFEGMKRFQVKEDDLIISCSGTVGKVSIIGRDDPKGIISQALLLLRVDKEKVLPQYLKYYFDSAEGYNAIVSRSSGSVQVNIAKREVIENIPIFIPNIETQQKVISILTVIDKKIEKNNAINDNLLQQAETLFKERFLAYDDLPLGWKRMILGDVSDMGAGGDKPKNISDQKTEVHQYPIYSNGISDEGLYGFTTDYKISEESVTVSARGTIGFICLRHIPYTPIVRLVTLVPRTSIVSAKYLYLWLKNIPIHGTGTTQQQLTVPDFRKTEIIIPPEADMKKFTETVDPLFLQVWANQEENAKLADIRDTLLPRLMSGELDVSDLDL